MAKRRGAVAVWLGLAAAVAAAAGLAGTAAASRLPLRQVTSADGLAQDQVRSIRLDHRGFLWFGTRDGLSRFDGTRFRTYDTRDGLAHPTVTSLLVSRDGTLWVGTFGGLCRFVPEGPPGRLFRCRGLGSTAFTRSVETLFEDRAGRLWAGTQDGLFRLPPNPDVGPAEEADLGASPRPLEVRALLEDTTGCLWVGSSDGLMRRCGDRGTFRHHLLQRRDRDNNRVYGLLQDRAGRIWVSLAYDGILVFQPGGAAWEPPPNWLEVVRAAAGPAAAAAAAPQPRASATIAFAGPPTAAVAALTRSPWPPGMAVNLMPADGLAHAMARGGVWASSDGTVWIGTRGGLSRFDGRRLVSLAEGSGQGPIQYVGAEDRAGNLWFGTARSGALRLNPRGFVTYLAEDGLPEGAVRAFFAAPAGRPDVDPSPIELFAVSDGTLISRFDGLRFHGVSLHLPAGADPGWGHQQSSFRDSQGEWWIATGNGLRRFPASASFPAIGNGTAAPLAVYTARNGLGGEQVFRLYEDSRHDIWISTLDGARTVRWERAAGTLHRFTAAEGFPLEAPTAFMEDRTGGVWIAFYHGGLGRFSAGRLTYYPPGRYGVPTDEVDQLLLDDAGRLWIAGHSSGLSCIPDPARLPPGLRHYTPADGLASSFAFCAIEDRFGRLYVCTGRGVDRLDLSTGAVAHLSLADGLASTAVLGTLRDARGDLWFGTAAGISRLSPLPPHTVAPPAAWLMDLRVDGRQRPVSQLGAATTTGLEIAPGQRQLEISFAAVGVPEDEEIRYQHRLSGIDRDWPAPSRDERVVYAALAPADYRFAVRAVTGDGRTGPPALLDFRVLAPWWRRPWAVALAASLLAAAAYAVYRLRLSRLLAIERVRTRVATDLHDDLGASLSRISLLSEVAARQIPGGAGSSRDLVREIGALARELFDSTADIVWAIDPRRDNLGSLVTRLSEYARDVLGAHGAAWSLAVPPGLDALQMPAERRRELYLLLKEAVHNAARHSRATAVSLTVTIAGQRLSAEVRDNGRGFDPGRGADRRFGDDGDHGGSRGGAAGDGLANMRQRAAALGGTCSCSNAADGGARVRVELPL